jgi:hypothetical protein
MKFHLALPMLSRRFGFLYKVWDGQEGLFTTDDHGNLIRVSPYAAAASLV